MTDIPSPTAPLSLAHTRTLVDDVLSNYFNEQIEKSVHIDGQAQPGAPGLAARAAALGELVEDALVLARGHAHALVEHAQQHDPAADAMLGRRTGAQLHPGA